MGFSRQEYWSGLPCPSPGDLPYPRIKPRSPSLQADSFPLELLWRSISYLLIAVSVCICIMSNDVTHLFMHLLANYIFSLENVYLSPLPILKLCCFAFLLLSDRNYLYDLNIKSVLDDWQTFSVWRDLLNKNHIVCVYVCVLVSQACLTLCDPMDCSPPGLSVHEILQARILEWVVIPFSRGSSWPRDQTRVSCISGRSLTVRAIMKPHNHLTKG